MSDPNVWPRTETDEKIDEKAKGGAAVGGVAGAALGGAAAGIVGGPTGAVIGAVLGGAAGALGGAAVNDPRPPLSENGGYGDAVDTSMGGLDEPLDAGLGKEQRHL